MPYVAFLLPGMQYMMGFCCRCCCCCGTNCNLMLLLQWLWINFFFCPFLLGCSDVERVNERKRQREEKKSPVNFFHDQVKPAIPKTFHFSPRRARQIIMIIITQLTIISLWHSFNFERTHIIMLLPGIVKLRVEIYTFIVMRELFGKFSKLHE